MRLRFVGVLIAACFGASLTGCGGGWIQRDERRRRGRSRRGKSSDRRASAALGGAEARERAELQRHGHRARSSAGASTNVADGAYSGVLEGNSNEVCDEESSIGGGYYNFISSGANTSYYSWIGSGYDNSISGHGYQSVIGGGNVNVLTAPNSVIGGGNQNNLFGLRLGHRRWLDQHDEPGRDVRLHRRRHDEHTLRGIRRARRWNQQHRVGRGRVHRGRRLQHRVGRGRRRRRRLRADGVGNVLDDPGGYRNTASAAYSFAAGAFGTAAQEGAFVWSDGSNGSTVLSSSRAYQFLARASGGFTLYTNAGATVGAQLAAGSGTWASLSDRNAKTNIAPLDDSAVLAKVAAMPISRWSYKSEHGVRHVGPMAQDFYAAFRVGEDDKHITSIDEDGVALAAIKALHAENAQLRAREHALRAEVSALKAAEGAHDRRVDAALARLEAK